jgi:hypothetical protein
MLSLPLVASDDMQIESKILFNTACAKCHEGECSGRLSFHLNENAIDQHILRHGGELSLARARQLSDLLSYMKEKCSFYPMSVDITQDGILEGKKLEKLKSPDSQAYFIPLGNLTPGDYIIKLHGIEADSGTCVEIIDASFEFVEKRIVGDASRKIGVKFHIDGQSEIYLRIVARKPIRLNKLELLNYEK